MQLKYQETFTSSELHRKLQILFGGKYSHFFPLWRVKHQYYDLVFPDCTASTVQTAVVDVGFASSPSLVSALSYTQTAEICERRAARRTSFLTYGGNDTFWLLFRINFRAQGAQGLFLPSASRRLDLNMKFSFSASLNIATAW